MLLNKTPWLARVIGCRGGYQTDLSNPINGTRTNPFPQKISPKTHESTPRLRQFKIQNDRRADCVQWVNLFYDQLGWWSRVCCYGGGDSISGMKSASSRSDARSGGLPAPVSAMIGGVSGSMEPPPGNRTWVGWRVWIGAGGARAGGSVWPGATGGMIGWSTGGAPGRATELCPGQGSA
jgi:hypothetical protein